jgi:hypothetical protein
MNARTVKEMLSDSIEQPPVTSINVDATIVRMRRTLRWRRSAAALAVVATVVITTTGIAIALRHGAGRGSGLPFAAPAATPSTSVTPSASSPEPAAGSESPAHQEARLTAAISSIMRDAMPKATFIANRSDHPGTKAFQVIASTPMHELESGADVRDSTGTGNVLLAMGDHGGAMAVCPDPTDSTCKRTTGPHGEIIVAFYDFLGDTTRSKMYRIDVTNTDGTWLVIQSQNWGMKGATGKVSRPTRPTPPLTVAQMIKAAIDPRLTLTLPAR